MSGGKGHVLDANVFIEAHQTYYFFDICPGFWRALLRQHGAKRVHSIDKVKAELVSAGDELSEWVKDVAPETLFKGTTDQKVVDVYREMVNWVQNERQFTPEAKAEFSRVADGWIVAYAKVNGLIVVTHEEYAPNVKKKVPMPNLCIEYKVPHCNTFEMLRTLKEQFVLRHGGAKN